MSAYQPADAFADTPQFGHTWRALQTNVHTGGRFGRMADAPLAIAVALGQRPERIAPLDATWRCMYFAAKLLDDVADGDNAQNGGIDIADGIALLAYGARVITQQTGWPQQLRLDVLDGLYTSLLYAAAGQGEEAQCSDPTLWPSPDGWLAIAERKSGEPFGWMAFAVGQVCGQSPACQQQLRAFGQALGVLLQVDDDASDSAHPLLDSKAFGAPSLPLCYLLHVARPAGQYETLCQHLRVAETEPSSRGVVAAALEDLGAPVFVQQVRAEMRKQAEAALENLRPYLADAAPLTALLGEP